MGFNGVCQSNFYGICKGVRALICWASTHLVSDGGKSFHAIKYCTFSLFLQESKISLTLKYCSPSISTGTGGGPFAGPRGEVIEDFNKLQYKTAWMRLTVFRHSNCTVSELIILIMGKGPIYFGPGFEGCLGCRYLEDR